MVRRPRDDSPEAGLFDAPPPEPGRAPREERVRSVGELTREVAGALGGLGRIVVEGELGGLKRASSGHVYFDLKDDEARLACVVWRSQVARALRFQPAEGMHVVARGRLDVYAPRGSYSLVVDALEQRGLGALLARLEELKAELRALGRFERRRPLPRWPRRVGVVTSRDGAALQDVLRTRSLRWPGYPLRVCHAAVQGPGAAREIAEALAALERSGVDVIVVCRGGGSLEDLWCFNERVVAEAVWRCGVPVVSGVGHESDTTLCDLVADHRAHTPTDAAQTVFPDRAELAARLALLAGGLHAAAAAGVASRAATLATLARRPVLAGAAWITGERARALEGLRARLRGAAAAGREAQASRLRGLATRLERQSPRARVERWLGRVLRAHERLGAQGARALQDAELRFARSAHRLEAISPLSVLARGYSLTRREGEAAPLRASDEVAPGDRIETRLARGVVRSRVTACEPPANDARGEPAGGAGA